VHPGPNQFTDQSADGSGKHTFALGYMKKETAIQIINEALNIAIAKGCFGLVEVTNIVKAVEFITDQPDIEFGEITED
jgi:hypothetical protein